MAPWHIARLGVTGQGLVVMALLAIAGCQPVPRPFEGFAPPDPALLRLPDRGGIVVLPVADAPPAAAEGLAQALAAALRAESVPAVTGGGNRESAFLQGRVDDPGHDAAVVWELYAGDGKPMGAHRQLIEGTPIREWALGEPKLMAALAQAGAGPIAALMRGGPVLEVARPRIMLAQVTGAPGDGNVRLTAAMRAALAGAVELVAEGTTALRIEGRVRVGRAENESQSVTITWAVRDGAGEEMGQVSQSNAVPAGSLDGAWGEVAVAVADWAAAGILDLLDEVQLRRAAGRI